MKYISAEEFLKQPKEVQKVFIDWWKNNLQDFDLWFEDFGKNKNSFLNGIYKGCLDISIEQKEITKTDYSNRKPLLTLQQLIEFIEEKTNKIVDVTKLYKNDKLIDIDIEICDCYYGLLKRYKDLGTDLLQAYWKVAVEIAKEC